MPHLLLTVTRHTATPKPPLPTDLEGEGDGGCDGEHAHAKQLPGEQGRGAVDIAQGVIEGGLGHQHHQCTQGRGSEGEEQVEAAEDAAVGQAQRGARAVRHRLGPALRAVGGRHTGLAGQQDQGGAVGEEHQHGGQRAQRGGVEEVGGQGEQGVSRQAGAQHIWPRRALGVLARRLLWEGPGSEESKVGFGMRGAAGWRSLRRWISSLHFIRWIQGRASDTGMAGRRLGG